MGDTQTTKAAETTRVKQKSEDRPPHEREYAPSAFAEATLFRAAASDDPTTPPQHMARVLRRLTAPHQKTGFLLQCQRHYGNAYVQRMVSSRDNGHSSPLEREAYRQEVPIAPQVTALQNGMAPDRVAIAHAEQAASLGGPENTAVQTKPLAVLITPNVQRQKEKDDEEDKPLQSKSAGSLAGSSDAGEEVEVRLSQSKGGGSPLPESVRTYMEPRFGVNFGHVRVHTGSDAIQMNRDVSAQAFTHGADIYYGAGSSPTNLQLTAHELTHVIQQTGGTPLQMKTQAQPLETGTIDPAVSLQHGRVVQREEQDEGPTFVETLAWKALDEVSPSLAPIVRKGPEGVFDWIKERASDAAAGVFNTLMAPIRTIAGVGAKLSGQFMPLLATLQDAAGKIASNDCSPLQQAAEKIEHIAEQIIAPIIETIQPIVAKIQEFLGVVWDKLGAPIWEWIQQYASQRWQEVKQLASWIWEISGPLRALGQETWEWLKKKIGIGEGPDGENGILQWLQGKLEAAWDWLKQQLEPFSKQLAVLKGVIVEVGQIVSPEGPVRAILAVASQVGSGIGWIKDNFGNGDAIVKARVYLEKTLLPPLAGALKKLGAAVTGLAGSLSGALNKLANSMVQAVDAASGSVVRFAASAVQWIADQITAVAGWANQQLTSLADMLQTALGNLLVFVNNFLEFLGKIGSVILDVWRLPMFLAEKVWNWVPACIRDPIVDFVIPIILRQIELFEELVRDNDAWQKTKAEVTKLIRQVFVDHDLMGALKGTFDLILRTFNIPKDLAVTVAEKAYAAWDVVVKKPLEFIKNTVRALGHGFKLLWNNIIDHLEFGIKGWLLGSIADKDIQFPNDWTKPREVFGFVMDLLGLSVSHIFDLLKTRINPRLVTKAQTWITRFQGAWNWITSMIDTSKSPAENAKGVMDKAKDFGKSILTGVVEWVSAKVAEELAILAAAAAASGGLSEVVDIARRIYKAMVSAKRWAGQILQMANETLDDISAIASGAVEKAGVKFKDIMHRGMPVVIGFLADQVGLGGVGPAMRNIVDKLRAKVDEAVLWLIDKAKAGIEALINAVSGGGTVKPDERTDEEKLSDLDKGMEESYQLLHDKKTTVERISKRLPAIKDKYRLVSLEVILDEENPSFKTIHFEGEVNPKKRGPKNKVAGSKKRGDHIFANNLSQTISEIQDLVLRRLGSSPEGKRLSSTLASCSVTLGANVYKLTIDKGDAPSVVDAHSVSSGNAAALLKAAMNSYVEALVNRSAQNFGALSVKLAEQAVIQAALSVELYIHEWIGQAVDLEAEALLPEKQAEITKGKADLENMKSLIIKTVKSL
jgi:Domain of unknown function (DUF4157)